ncbi:MAG: hypothetical protein AABW53_01500 [Nanoarchaeota archaeon]
MNNDLFFWLVEYHCKANLERCLLHMEDGKVYLHGKALDERRLIREELHPGLENELYTGVLLVANGTTLIDRLSEGDVIKDDPEDVRFEDVKDKEAFFRYLSLEQGNDGAHIYDGVNKRIARISEFNNNPPLQEKIPLGAMVPADFLSSDGSVLPKHVGVKTRLAIKMPLAYDHTSTFQIKRTAYGNTGLGKVTHFGPQGLKEEFFFHYDPTSNGPFVDEKHGIVGVYRAYERNEKGELVKTMEQLIGDPREYFNR